VLFVALTLSSCITAPTKISAPTVIGPVTAVAVIQPGLGTMHIVARGETLWRISKMYGVSVDDIRKANNLEESEILETNQQLLIPKIALKQPKIPLYKTSKWKHIIIHHSATNDGDVSSLSKLHLKRGFNNGLGYDFVIDNGSNGRQDGQVEISSRWIKQQNGAHCKASRMNYKGIGICLVGNFEEKKVSEKQLESLIYLVRTLKEYYRIPDKNILGHGQVRGAKTKCPGQFFPWEEFKSRIK
jgi:N-acetyl-anhydromuramyl-L-alanine amidase AmpD